MFVVKINVELDEKNKIIIQNVQKKIIKNNKKFQITNLLFYHKIYLTKLFKKSIHTDQLCAIRFYR